VDFGELQTFLETHPRIAVRGLCFPDDLFDAALQGNCPVADGFAKTAAQFAATFSEPPLYLILVHYLPP
jgi:hypothetical protein